MREKNFLKNKCEQTVSDTFEEQVVLGIANVCKNISKKKILIYSATGLLLLSTLLLVVNKGLNEVATSETNTVKVVSLPVAAVSSKKSVITIPSGVVKVNPFLPYRDISGYDNDTDASAYSIVEPPLTSGESSEAARVMDTIVSGILYDKFSPSAILNIEGNDYLVKKGDVVNNYKVLNIVQDSVTVSLGANVYKAGIGEILTEGTLNYNNVSNLNNKFGGEK